MSGIRSREDVEVSVDLTELLKSFGVHFHVSLSLDDVEPRIVLGDFGRAVSFCAMAMTRAPVEEATRDHCKH